MIGYIRLDKVIFNAPGDGTIERNGEPVLPLKFAQAILGAQEVEYPYGNDIWSVYPPDGVTCFVIDGDEMDFEEMKEWANNYIEELIGPI